MSVEDKGFAMLAYTGEAQEIVGRTGEAQEIVGASDDGTIGKQVTSLALSAWTIGGMISGPAMAYHGYKRNNGSVGWALGWGLLGWLFFPVTPAIAVAQGFGKPKED